MADVTERMLALLALLQTGRAFGGDELAERLAVSPRTLRRDIDRLRGYGYPVDTRPGPGGHYRLTAGAALPPLMLGDDEAIATMLGLAALAASGSAAEGSLDDAAMRAYGKVEQYLPKRLRQRAARLRASLETGLSPAPSADAEYLGVLADAIEQRFVVVFDYERQDGSVAERRVEPHRQIHYLMRWYLLGWDSGRGDWRVFRIDRMSGLRATTWTFEARPLPADSAIDYLKGGLGKERERVVLIVEAPASAVADAFRHEEVELQSLGERRTRAVLRLDTWQWLLLSLGFLDADFTVEEPPQFRASLKEFGARISEC